MRMSHGLRSAHSSSPYVAIGPCRRQRASYGTLTPEDASETSRLSLLSRGWSAYVKNAPNAVFRPGVIRCVLFRGPHKEELEGQDVVLVRTKHTHDPRRLMDDARSIERLYT